MTELSRGRPDCRRLVYVHFGYSQVEVPRVLRLLPLEFLLSQHFDSREKIGSLQIPILLIHGTDDVKVPFFMTEQLYALAPETREILLIPGGGHANRGSIGWVEYSEHLTAFVQDHFQVAEADAAWD